MSKRKFEFDGQTYILEKPAILVGNGINYLENDNGFMSWNRLLFSLIPQEIRNDLGMDNPDYLECDLDGLTYPEIAELANQFNKNSSPSIKKQISYRLMELKLKRNEAELNTNHKKLVSLAKKNRWPILTTNYDNLLLSGLDIVKTESKSRNMQRFMVEEPFIISKEGTSEVAFKRKNELVNLYYRETKFKDCVDVKDEFAIWPIHGTVRFPGSLCLTNKDYSKYSYVIEKSTKNISHDSQKTPWLGKYDWTNIMMNNDLIIIGLALDSNETDLRALLVKRHAYLKSKKMHSKTIYIYRDDSEMPKGKALLFNALDITCVRMNSRQIYDFKYL